MKQPFFKISFWVALVGSLALYTASFAWSGETWEPISREEIGRRADEMIDVRWSPKNTFTLWGYGDKYQTFSAGIT